jgi:ferredoxin
VKPKPVNPSSPLAGPSIETILFAVRRTGLVPRGALRLEPGERNGALAGLRTIVLAGMAGRDGWSAFAASPEAHDGADHPLDRWSRRVIGRLARELGAQALFPFGGPPFLPFQQWAGRAEPVHPSPIGLLIHPRYGLWHSYRGALGFPEALDVPEPAAVPNPCESCSGRWCLKACPVGAFSVASYDVAACVGHLKSAEGADCMGFGCQARRACPVGAEHAYGPEQASFTMRAFLRGQDR